MRLSDVKSTPFHPSYQTVAAAFYLAGGVALAVAFGVALAAFLQASRERRNRTLAGAGMVFAVYGTANLVSDLINLVKSASSNPTWLFTAGESSAAAGELALVVAAGLVAVGVLSTAPNSVLGGACLLLGTHFAFAAAGYGFALAGYHHLFTPGGRFTGGLVTIAVGQTFAAAAAGAAAVAFFTGGSSRGRGLGVAAAVFVLGFLTTAVGWTLFATLNGGAENWLSAASQLALAVAAAVGAVAFFRPLEQRDGPYLAVPPDPV